MEDEHYWQGQLAKVILPESCEGHSAAQRERTQVVSHHLVDFSQSGSFHELVHTLMVQVYFYPLSSLVQRDLLGFPTFDFWPQWFPPDRRTSDSVLSTSRVRTIMMCFNILLPDTPLLVLPLFYKRTCPPGHKAPLPREKLKVPLDLFPWKQQVTADSCKSLSLSLEPKVRNAGEFTTKCENELEQTN